MSVRFPRFTPVIVTYRDTAVDEPGWRTTTDTAGEQDYPIQACGFIFRQGKTETWLVTTYYRDSTGETHTNGRFIVPTGAIMSITRVR